SLAPDYIGKTCIGNVVRGLKDGAERTVFIYNVADHAEAFAEVGSQAISYTAGVPAAAAAILVARGDWDVGGMVNAEDLPARPFLRSLDLMGLPTRIRVDAGDRPLRFERRPEERAPEPRPALHRPVERPHAEAVPSL